jgi:hypothetical protein
MKKKDKLPRTKSRKKAEQISNHDGTLGFLDALRRKAKGKSVDVNLDG